jgi:pimeloyl-ACP methyl ester carboxylesterase
MRGIARLVGEFLGRLDLQDVTLVLNDWGGALLLFSEGPVDRVKRLILTSCEAFDNVPPGLPGRMAVLAARIPGGLIVAMQQLRFRFMRRSSMAFGLMSKRPIPHEVMDSWFQPVLTQPKVRRDLKKYLCGAKEAKRDLIAATEHLRTLNRPALVAWAAEDRVMPPEHGRRLAEILTRARLVEIQDSYTLIPEDQPGELAGAIRRFVRDTP